MAKHLTPIIGLAVVMALALAAVFGSMSLANPAMAAIGQPADGELTERTFAPQGTTSLEGGTVHTGQTVMMDIANYVDGGLANFDALATDPAIVDTANLVTADFTVAVGLNNTLVLSFIGDTVTGTADDDGCVSGTVRFWLDLEDDSQQRIDMSLKLCPATAPSAIEGMMLADMVVEAGTGAATNTPPDYMADSFSLDLSDYFQDGVGTEATSEIVSYSVSQTVLQGGADAQLDAVASSDEEPMWAPDDFTTGTALTVTIATAGDVVQFRAKELADAGDAVTVTITPSNGGGQVAAAAQSFAVDIVARVVAPMAVTGLEVVGSGDGYVDLEWDDPVEADEDRIDKYQGREMPDGGDYSEWGDIAPAEGNDAADVRSARISGLTNGVEYTFQVRAVVGTKPGPAMEMDADAVVAMPMAPREPVLPSFDAGSTSSYSNTNYTVEFQTGADSLNTLSDELVIEFHEDYTLPESISTSAVTIDVHGANPDEDMGAKRMLTFNPSDIVVDGEEAVFSLGDMNEDDDVTQYEIMPMAVITVKFRQAAGIRNPTEAGNFELVKIAFGDDLEIEYNEDDATHAGLLLEDGVRRKISLSEEDGGLGDMVTATAKGFENGVTLHFFLDKMDDKGMVNGMLDAGEDVLCSVPSVSGSNVGSCEFEVTTPTFSTGYNFVNAVDGDGNIAWDPMNDDHRFELKASISASPAGGSPGEIMQVQLVSFPMGMAIQEIKLSGDYICGGVPPRMTETVSCSSYGPVGSMGTASIAITVPNWAVAGKQELRIKAGGKTDTTNVTIVGPRIISTPATVVANQRVSLVGTGFSPNSVLGDDTDAGRAYSRMSIGGHPIGWAKVNDGRDVNVDDGGNWAASVDLPLVEATTGSGERTIRVTDSKGRTGSVKVALAERNFDITPESGRVGTLAVVRGVGYPSKNDEGHSFTIDVIYKVQEGATARVSVVPDASGRFEVQLRIPTTASIPSTNQVEVSFDHEMGGTSVLENKQHMVPEGIIELSATSGGPGTMITVTGVGFKTFVPVESVKIGTIEITPSPKPNTDANGMLDFDVLIPGLDVGIQTVEVRVGGTTSSTGFTVTESAVSPGDIRPVAEAISELGDNLVSVWNFNNDTKVWAFYDPTLSEGNTLTHMITGETYLLRIKTTTEVILNRDTRSLTCVGGNCWNQIVW